MNDRVPASFARATTLRIAIVSVAALVLGVIGTGAQAAGSEAERIDNRNASIVGTVTLPDGAYSHEGAVRVRDVTTGVVAGSGSVRNDGTYEVDRLLPGSYRVTFDRLSGYAIGAAQFFSGQAEHEGVSSADPVTLVNGQTAEGVDATIALGGSIVGHLVDASGSPLLGCLLQAYTRDGSLVTRAARSGHDGAFSVGGLSTGGYFVRVVAGPGQCRAGTQHFEADGLALTADRAAASSIDVEIGQPTTLGASLVYHRGATISGALTLPDGSWIRDGRIVVRDAVTGVFVRAARANRQGRYSVQGLPAGSFRMTFNRVSGYAFAAAQFYRGHAEGAGAGSADLINLAEGEAFAADDTTLAAGGSISGTLVNARIHCEVQAVDLRTATMRRPGSSGLEHLVTRTSYTERGGSFQISGLSTGDYLMRVVGSRRCSFGTQFYAGPDSKLAAGADHGAPVSVTLGADTPLGELTPDVGGLIGGHIDFEGDRRFHGDGRVVVRDADTGAFVGSTRANRTGGYQIAGLAAGSYRVTFDRLSGYANWAAQFFDGVPEEAGRESSDPVTLADGEARADVDATMQLGGRISGRLVDSAGQPVTKCQVQAVDPRTVGYNRPGQTGLQHLVTRTGFTTRDGEFSIGGLSTGDYLVRVVPSRGCLFGTQFFSGDGEFAVAPGEPAQSVGVTVGEFVEINEMVLRLGGVIAGHIAGTSWVSDVPVVVRDFVTGAFIKSGRANRRGNYSIRGLAAGSYRVTFNRLSGMSQRAAQFYSDVPENAGSAEATPVELAEDDVAMGIDASLDWGGRLTGRLVDDSGNPLKCFVQAVDPRTATRSNPGHSGLAHLVTRSDLTNSKGQFAITGLGTGDFLVRVVPSKGCKYRIQYVDADGGAMTFDPAQATPFAVDGDLVEVGQVDYFSGGAVRGQITLPSGGLASDLRVVVRDLLTGRVAGHGKADASGAYSVVGLSAGSYRVSFNRISGEAFSAAQFYDGTGEHDGPASATTVVLAEDGDSAEGVDATLAAGGRIVGRIVQPSGSPARWCQVQAFTRDRHLVTRATYTARNGTFSLGGLSTGDYRLRTYCHEGVRFYTGSDDGTMSRLRSDQALVRVTMGGSTTLSETLVYGDSDTPSIRSITAPVISGAAEVGEVLSATTGSWNPENVTVAYQWLADETPIPGAIASTYTPVTGDIDKRISVGVTATKAGHQPASAESAQTAPVRAKTPPPQTPSVVNATRPTVSGVAEVGGKLTSTSGTWTPSDVTVAYQWLADGAPIVGAAGSTYSPVAGDVGKRISVRVTASKAGHTNGTSTSEETTAVVAPDVVNVTAPTVSGQAKVGRELTATAGTWNPSDVSLAYQWLADGAQIANAAGSTYSPVAGDLGKRISVQVTASKAGYKDTTATSDETDAVSPAEVANVTKPEISGVARVGEELTASAGTWEPSDVTVAYQWLSDGDEIAGATGSSYSLRRKDLRSSIAVTVTATSPGAAPVAATSDARTVKLGTFEVPGDAELKGQNADNPNVGERIGVKAADVRGDVTVEYQWLRNGKVIRGETGEWYRIEKQDRRDKLSVRVTYSRPGYQDVEQETSSTTKVKGKNAR